MFKRALILVSLSLGLWASGATASSLPAHNVATDSIEYLLSIDRLHFYTQNLTDFLEGKKSPALVSELRTLKPEDFYAPKWPVATLTDPAQWQKLIFETLRKKNPLLDVQYPDLEWNYNFFKNKLREGFSLRAQKPGKEKMPFMADAEENGSQRSVPRVKGDKYLLDVERYIAEKTTRAIIWDAILNDRDFEFHIGTQREFNDTVRNNQIQILGEVKPMARNYNKIYFTFNPKTTRYAYAMNAISGNDRVLHLMAQLRVLKFGNKSYLETKDKVRVYGNVAHFHRSQEEALLKIYNRLPVADQVVIGQKGAIDGAITSAGMVQLVSQEMPKAMMALAAPAAKASKFEKLIELSKDKGAFQLDALNSSPVKLDDAYAKIEDSVDRNYRQFNSEQPSHEFTDYLLLDKNGDVKRWRVISAVWGDEIIPIANALKKSGHKNIVYIGTAGAIAGKGLVVGDVVPGKDVLTHSGKVLAFYPNSLMADQAKTRTVTVGQVHTPFDETGTWLEKKGPTMDIVEVETGYLREVLGDQVRLEAYFLISDVVGSENETLAHAAQSSSKRKRGQLKLLESLFMKNNIVAPISNYEPIPEARALKTTLATLQKLRPSRDPLSLYQVAQLAVKNGQTSEAQLEVLLKSQPAFDREAWDGSLKNLGQLLSMLQRSLPRGAQVGLLSETLFNGTFNPKVASDLLITSSYSLNEAQMKQMLGSAKWDAAVKSLAPVWKIRFDSEARNIPGVQFFDAKDSGVLAHLIENHVYNRSGFARELDVSGKYKIKEIPGLSGGLRCSVLF